MTLKELRQELRGKRRSLSDSEREKKSLAITRNLTRLLPFQRARRIAFYMPTTEEVDTRFAIDFACQKGKEVYLPVINSGGFRQSPMLFERYRPGESMLKANRYGILEPVHTAGGGRLGQDLDITCVPLVGFNIHCDRIGMGAGYYDRTFSRKKTKWRQVYLVGLAFACQQAEFEADSHDVPMHAVVTESETFFSNR